ncbi:hypothetical protein B0H17DRAFT_1090236 [Mycena rosella]|uniref:Uncharacterized protein n=1 Tax=Mycena rosella TaxID=1033263 RepID=A0AAD7CVH5_MYCRO|nr:hypothetical protein B0H17DRAFT_1090236 [Mycena rosella]
MSGLFTALLVVRLAFPTRMIKSLDASLHDVERLYFNTFETHLANHLTLESYTDVDLTARLRILQNTAAILRVQALSNGTFFMQWAGEFWGLCKGHSFAIWRCRRHIQCLGNEIQLRQEAKFHEFKREIPSGSSPAWQLTMRRMYHCRDVPYGVGCSASCSSHLSC